MAERALKRMTVEEFFDWQLRQDKNYELVDGVPVLPLKSMTGATSRHDSLTVNSIIALGYRLRGKSCVPRTADTSIKTFRGTRRPDVTIECGKPDPRSMAADDPRVVIEILSPSTMRFDRFQKLEEYKAHDRIRVILLVDSEAPQVAVWRRGDDGAWAAAEQAGLQQVIALPEIGTELPLAELYEGVEFDPPGFIDTEIPA